MTNIENNLRALEIKLSRLQRDFERLRSISGAGDSSYVQTTRQVISGNGLSGGGNLSEDRTLSVRLRTNNPGLAFSSGALYVDTTALVDVTAGLGLISNAGAIDVNVGHGIVINDDKVNIASTAAGQGLFWNETVSPRRFDIGAGTLITVGTDSIGLSNGLISQYISTTANSTTPAWRNLSALAGSGIDYDLTNDRFFIGAGTLITVGTDSIGLSNGLVSQYISTTASSTTPAWRNLSALAGSGIDYDLTNDRFFIGTGNGLTVTANAVELNTPGTLTVSTTNSAINNHTHEITSTSNATSASLLSSNSSGYLQLIRLGLGMSPTRPLDVNGDAGVTGQLIAGSGQFSGTVNIVNSGDLFVGNVLQVNTAGTRVGINRAPDQQFDLDVAGAIRGQYLIGKHAIQLASAIGVFHYDGPAPYRLDNTGSDSSHMGVGGAEAGGVIYRPGKFGKAAQVAEATTNLVTNPSFETGNATGWTNYSTGSGTGSRTVVQGDVALYGDYAYEIKKTGGTTVSAYGTYFAFNVVSGKTYTYSAWVKIATYSGGTGQVNVYGTGNIPSTTVSLSGATKEWQRATFTVTATGTGTSAIYCWIHNADTMTLYLDGVQVEEKGNATPYCDGSLGTGHSWSGTAHASTSSRTGATLRYPNNADLNPEEGSIMMWVRHEDNHGRGMGLFGTGANGQFDAFVSNTGSIIFRQNTVQQTYSAGIVPMTWYHVAFTWSSNANTRKIFVNGIEVASQQFDTGATVGTQLFVGSVTAGSDYTANGLVDEFVLLEYPAEPKLIRAIYESNAPVFVESSVFHWRSPARVPIWVDEYGLWARGVNGGEILGLYGGDPRNPTGNVTRSWGGITMEENDIVIGRVAGAVVDWDDSAGELLVGRPSASNLLLSGGLAQMRDGTTVYGQWSNSGLVIGRTANSSSRLEITSTGALNIINRSAGGSDTTAISLSNNGNASFTGEITATTGNIGGWGLLSDAIYSNNIAMYSGAIGTARLQVGNTGYIAGIASAGSTNDITFWAGASHSNRENASFRVTAGGILTATGVDVTGKITAQSGTVGGWALGTSSLTAGSSTSTVGLSSSTTAGAVAIYAGSTTPTTAPFRVTNQGAVTIGTNGSLTWAGGKGVANSDGIYLIPDGLGESDDRAYLFKDNTNTFGGLYAFYTAGASPTTMTLRAKPNGSQNVELSLLSEAGTATLYAAKMTAFSSTTTSEFRFNTIVGATSTRRFTISPTLADFEINLTVEPPSGTTTATERNFTVKGTQSNIDTDYAKINFNNIKNSYDYSGASITARITQGSGANDYGSSLLFFTGANTFGGAGLYEAMRIDHAQRTIFSGPVTFNGQVTVTGNIVSNVTISKSNPTVTLSATSGLSNVTLSSADNGNSIGQIIVIGRNSNSTLANQRGGVLRFIDAGDTARNVWAAADGVLRIGTSAPNQAGNVADGGGNVVGAQTSHESYKTIIEGQTPIADVMARLTAVASHVHRFQYLPNSGGPMNETFEGIVLRENAPETHHYGTDKYEASYSAGKNLNLVNLCGDLLRAVVYLQERVEALH